MSMLNTSQTMNIFDKAINHFYVEGQKIKGVYDLLVRGTSATSNKEFTDYWSDLDLSIIVEKLDFQTLSQIQKLYKGIKQFFPFKLSITPVSKIDFSNNTHHHGTKPIFYTYTLNETNSLLKRKYHWDKIDIQEQKNDSLMNVIILVHDIRSRFLKLENDNKFELNEFFCHLIKRSKHIIRNAIFIKTGILYENIEDNKLQENFSNIPNNFYADLDSLREKYKYYMGDKNFILSHIRKTIEIIEAIYSQLID